MASRREPVFPWPIERSALDNGLEIVCVPFGAGGLVAYWTVVRAGSRNEVEPGKTGFAHFFEHMMFRGTVRWPPEAYNDVLRRLGADVNAFTTADYTAYHALAAASALPLFAELEADRFENLSYSLADFRREAGAVEGEYLKNHSHPLETMFEKLQETAFTRHTYRHTTMGFLDDIRAMPDQYDYSLAFFDRWYRPEHTTLLVAGDVDPARVRALAEQRYGSWRRGSYRLETPAEPPQTEERRVEMPWPNPTLAHLLWGYRAPAFSVSDPQSAALDLLGELAFSRASPLYRDLVLERQLAETLWAGAPDHRDPFLFLVFARVHDDGDLAAVETRIDEELERLASTPATEQRLDRARSHLRYGLAAALSSAEGAASTLAGYIGMGTDPGALAARHELYEQVGPGDVAAAAAQVLCPRNRTAVTLREGRT